MTSCHKRNFRDLNLLKLETRRSLSEGAWSVPCGASGAILPFIKRRASCYVVKQMNL
jgi:hypothetical protein